MNLLVSAAARLNWRRQTLAWHSSLYVNAYHLMAANVVTAAFGFLYWTTAARLYPPSEVGLAAAAISAIGLVSMASALGLDHAMVRFLPQSSDPQGVINSSLTIGGCVALVLSSVFLAGTGIWSPALLPLRESPLLAFIIIGGAVFATITSLLGGAYLARKQAGLVLAQASVFSIAKVLLAVVLSAVVSVAGLMGAWTLALALAAVCGISLFLPRAEGGRHGFLVMLKRRVLNDMTHFAFANYVTTLLWSVPGLILPLLVINTIGPAANAHFYVAWSVGGLIAMVPMAVSLSVFVHGSYDADQVVRRAMDGAKFTFLVLAPAVGAVFLLGDKILLIFGKAYSEQATSLLWILAAGALPMAVNLLFFSVRRVQQRMGGVILSSVWILLVTVALSILLLPRIGLLGAGVAWLLAQTSTAAAILAGLLFAR